MKESNQLFKSFENKKIILVTKGGFTYNTSNLEVFEDCVRFTDNRNQVILISFDEIKFVQEVQNGQN